MKMKGICHWYNVDTWIYAMKYFNARCVTCKFMSMLDEMKRDCIHVVVSVIICKIQMSIFPFSNFFVSFYLILQQDVILKINSVINIDVLLFK